ncbi:MAG: cell division ATP-binding protein FtsE [Flavobacteriales bacterium]|jgi:cell division transport system ATP-binding protein|tara:strand:+ start:25529 stop:26212 length:684 start_codon:yes stop_codon:yes gene_type:complete
MSNQIIKLEGVSIDHLEHNVLDNINLSIKKGEFIYLIGDTGSGKTSLVKSLYAEIKVSAGNINIIEYDLNYITKKEIPMLRRKIGIVFQDFQLLSDRNIAKNLEFVLKSTGWKNKKNIDLRIDEVLKKVQLIDVKEKMPYQLSGGEQQRAAIARAILNNPEIILADEPTGNLDPYISQKIIDLLKEINITGTTILIATHDYEIIKNNKSRIIKCNNKNLQEISIEEL